MSESSLLVVSAGDHVRGRADALVTLIEYGDYECVHCGRAYHVVKAVERRIGAALRFVFRNFPLRELHAHAEGAARAAEAAAAQGKFWEMHDTLLENQRALAPQHLRRYADGLSLDLDQWERDLHAQATSARVQKDLVGGQQSGVQGTPTFFLNGRPYQGAADERGLILAIEAELRAHHEGVHP